LFTAYHVNFLWNNNILRYGRDSVRRSP